MTNFPLDVLQCDFVIGQFQIVVSLFIMVSFQSKSSQSDPSYTKTNFIAKNIAALSSVSLSCMSFLTWFTWGEIFWRRTFTGTGARQGRFETRSSPSDRQWWRRSGRSWHGGFIISHFLFCWWRWLQLKENNDKFLSFFSTKIGMFTIHLPLLWLVLYLSCYFWKMTQIPDVVEPSVVEVSYQRLCLEA